MPESPTFESIARRIVRDRFEQLARRFIALIDPDGAEEDEHPIDDLHRRAIANQLTDVAEQLRQVWNARGAADVELLAADGTSRTGIDKMLQTLDR